MRVFTGRPDQQAVAVRMRWAYNFEQNFWDIILYVLREVP